MTNEMPRDLQHVTLLLIDGTEVRGVLYRAPGTRTLDFLNRQAETFVAMTDAVLTRDGDVQSVPFVAVNKAAHRPPRRSQRSSTERGHRSES